MSESEHAGDLGANKSGFIFTFNLQGTTSLISSITKHFKIKRIITMENDPFMCSSIDPKKCCSRWQHPYYR